LRTFQLLHLLALVRVPLSVMERAEFLALLLLVADLLLFLYGATEHHGMLVKIEG
jgi:hypothetical protein